MQFNIKSLDIPSHVNLLAVSKGHCSQSIQAAYDEGIIDFGENYIQEWQKKRLELAHLTDIRWHIIGPVQKNKLKFLNEHVYCLQSLDSISLAQEIEKRWSYPQPLRVLLQLQLCESDLNKRGANVEYIKDLYQYVAQSNTLNLQGFMGIGPAAMHSDQLYLLYQNFVKICHKLWDKKERAIISLGMSQDYQIAIRCGSNMVRLGTALFGKRN